MNLPKQKQNDINNFLQDIFLYSGDLIIFLDLDLNIIDLNPTAEQICVWNKQQVVGKNFLQLSDSYKYKSPLPAELSTLFTSQIPLKLISSFGKHTISWTIVAIKNTGNEAQAILLIGKDITQNININNKLNELSMLQKIVAALPAYVYWKDVDGVYRLCNDNFVKNLNFTSCRDVIGNTDYDLLPKNMAEMVRATDQEIMRSHKKKIVENCLNFNGEEDTYLTHKAPIFDEKGKCNGIVGVSMNITYYIKQEEKLRQAKQHAEKLDKNTTVFLANMNQEVTGQTFAKDLSSKKHAQILREYLEAIIARMPGYVYWKNREGVYLGCNDNLVNMVGLNSRRNLIGKTDIELAKTSNWFRGLANSFRDVDIKVMETGKEILNVEELPFKHANGSIIYELTNKVPLRNNEGEVIGVLGISIDISKRKKMERELVEAKEIAEKVNEAKNQFMANMEHDLRTPCSGIAEMTNILYVNESDSNKKETLGYVARASKQLLELLNNILEFNHIESKKLPIIYKKFDVRQLVNDIVAMEFPYAKQKKLPISVKCEDNVPEILIGDKFRVSRILINLVSNAIKFTAKGSVKIIIELAKTINKKNILLKFIIKDTGIGIPQDKQQIIYERFSRLHPSNTNMYKGSGLGLSIVKQFINELEGEINVESNMNQGTTFECILPFEIPLLDVNTAEKTIKKDSITSEEIKQANNNKFKILLIEDDLLAQKVATYILQEQLINSIDFAGTGKAAIHLTTKNQYDLILMDIGLPNVSGYEVTRKIRTSKNNLNKTSIIVALTAHNTAVAKKDCIKVGMNDFMTKPITSEKIHNIFTTWLTIDKDVVKTSFKLPTITPVGNASEKSISKIIDLELGAGLVEGDIQLMYGMLDMLIKELPEVQDKMRQAYEAKSLTKLYALVHKLHGGCCYCGVPRLKAAAKNFEAIASKAKTTQKIQLAYIKLNKEIVAVLRAYKELHKL
jgi:PAS domain S-box-containing protein